MHLQVIAVYDFAQHYPRGMRLAFSSGTAVRFNSTPGDTQMADEQRNREEKGGPDRQGQGQDRKRQGGDQGGQGGKHRDDDKNRRDRNDQQGGQQGRKT
jgi:hypothetical protein